jgi:hypothetical protein
VKRSVTDVLRRGLESTTANWPLIAIRIAATIAIMLMVVLSIVAAVVPLLVSAGLSHFNPADAKDAAEAIVGVLTDHWIVLIYIFLLMTAVLIAILMVHSFIEAGAAQIVVDAERQPALAAFSMDRWLAGARHSWWTLFWIYNIVWSVGLLFMLVPLIATLVFMLLVGDNTGRIIIGCAGIAFAVLIMLPVSIVCSMWTEKAIVIAVARNAGARDASSIGWRELRADFGRHFGVGLIIIAISFGASIVVSSFSIVANISHQHAPLSGLMFAPMQIIGSLLHSVISAAIGVWLLAAFAAMTEER